MYVTANGLNKDRGMHGRGTCSEDMVKGLHWMQKAADLGHVEAQN